MVEIQIETEAELIETEAELIETEAELIETEAESEVETEAPKLVYMTTSNLNLRALPTTDSEILITMPVGSVVTEDPEREAAEGWKAVIYTAEDGQEMKGFVSQDYIQALEIEQQENDDIEVLQSAEKTFVTTDNLILRAGPDKSYDKILTMPIGSIVVNDPNNDAVSVWLPVIFTNAEGEEITGWASSDYLDAYKEQ